MFEFESGVAEMIRQKIVIYTQNIIGYFKFLIEHPGFWHNKMYKPFYIFNENE